jgi:chromosome condensin MukBEF ATPase and DNA-binding subunit MukB
MKTHHLAWAFLGLGSAVTAFAADPVTDAMTSAYAPYRAALYRTNSKSQADSEAAIAQAKQSWKVVAEQFAKAPPAPYNRDAHFAKTVAEVAAVYELAETEIKANKLPEAHNTLEKARDLMADIRRRNGVVVFSDHMNAYHAEMEAILEEAPKLASQSQGMLLVMERMGSLQYLARQLRAEAPAHLLSDSGFVSALQSLEKSLAALRETVLAQDAAKFKELLPKIKGPYSQLFLKFG